MQYSLSAVVRFHTTSITAAGLAPATITWYASQLRVYEDWRRDNGWPDVLPSEQMLEEYIAAQQRLGLRPRTVHARYRALQALLNFAEQRRMLDIEENPVHFVHPPRIPRERPVHVTLADFRRIDAAVQKGASWLDHRDRVVFHVLYFAGLRLGEVCALQVADLDMQKMQVWVRKGKGSKPRTVPIASDVRQPLLEYLYERPSHSRHLLLSSTTGMHASGPLTSEGLRMMLKRRCAQAGLPMLSAHKWRHGFAMWLREQGADLSDIAAVMGHTTTQVTQMYYAFTLAPTARKAYDRALARLREEGQTQ